MYTPLAIDQVRIEQERLRRRAECTLRRTETAESVSDESTHRTWTPRRFHRRPAAA